MNNYRNPFPTFFVLILSCFSLLSCHSSDSNTTVSPADDQAFIKESPLPKGRQVIDDNAPVYNNRQTDQAALGKDGDGANTHGDLSVMPVADRTAFLKKKFKNLLVFHADDTMQVNTPKLATLILSKDQTVEKMKLEVLDESNAKDQGIKTDTTMDFGSKMKAKLIAFGSNSNENSFTIEALGDDIQSFSTDRKKILWQWKVTPLKPGQQELKLSVQIIEKDGEAVSLPARNIPVIIFAKPESFLSSVGDFISRKYEFLITAIMIPIIIAFFTTRMRNKSPQNQQSQQQSGNRQPTQEKKYPAKRKK
ncbi:MAG: hypothetical protein ABIP30_06195 [Ferruginibacter sp.]